jgi:hypothetical protein
MNARSVFLCLSFSLLLCAADPWKDKKPSDWTSKDAARVLKNSPWAKAASAEMDFSRAGGGSGGPGGPGGGPPGGGMEGGPPPGGEMGGPPGGEMGPMEQVVRWESAAPVRAAAAKAEDPNEAKIAELAKDYYVISLSGGPMMPGGRPPQDGQSRPQPDERRMEKRLLANTALNVKGQDPIAPEKVEVLESAEGMMTLLLFPRSREIRTEDKEVTFTMTMGQMLIKAKFQLKDMVFEGRLAL